MQRYIAILLLACLHAQPAVNISVWIDFLANNEYIKEVLCINKERPKLSCNGKCYLMQQLQEKQSQQEQELPQLVHSKYEFVFFSFRESITKVKRITNNKQMVPFIANNYSHLVHWDIFHPPQA
ncbi:MAG: hypothetical protein Mars2KO_42300 [Maribacter sp.]